MIKTVTIVFLYIAIILIGVSFPYDASTYIGDFFKHYLDLGSSEEDLRLLKRIRICSYDILVALSFLIFVGRDYWMWRKTGTKSAIIAVSFWGLLVVALNFIIIVVQSVSLLTDLDFGKDLANWNIEYWLLGYVLFNYLFTDFFDKAVFKIFKR